MKFTNTIFITVFICILSINHSFAEAGKNTSDVVGKKDFINYCASCHGSNGKGDGPIVHFLKRKPKDLTQLSISNDDAFPFERIWGVFDGSYAMEEHGSSEMPIWGYKFIQETQESGQPNTVAKAKALDIILYLQIIQE